MVDGEWKRRKGCAGERPLARKYANRLIEAGTRSFIWVATSAGETRGRKRVENAWRGCILTAVHSKQVYRVTHCSYSHRAGRP
ncbi:hypothetical protein WN55_01213 [Dufourea novaeangliae]|uniref:Uncharacterized protein n=1 Tax=Dufourea novaeangliae TaxID=178035 RepID=A0A154NWI5_DUFNO|nr:hypothetical protein WN55_01213 [Dufourea novaeangliae]